MGPGKGTERGVSWRLIAAGPAIALITVIAALLATGSAGVSFRDPDHVAALYVLEVGAGVALMVGLDILLRARRRTGARRLPSREAMQVVRRERWTRSRIAAVATALVSFYVTYLAYRNLKAVVPLLRPGELFDSQLADIDRITFFGHDPTVLLHDLLGTGIAAHVFSTFYVAFIVFLPLGLGLALVFAERLQVSLFYAAALSINWILGAISYFLLPALGPVYVDTGTFAALPHTEVTTLQQMLLDDRVAFLADPATGTPQAIAAFASLHVAMSFTALLTAHMLNLARWVKQALWAWLILTFIATVYLGWHYFIDDLAGLVIGAAALVLARVATGFDPRGEATRGPAVRPEPQAAPTRA
jgi:membrane-associated phospholipid phosphatase